MHTSLDSTAGDTAASGTVLLVSCYELGHQPLGIAVPAARLAGGGHRVRLLDLSVERLDPTAVRAAQLVGISVPMHTALRIGIEAAQRIRGMNPHCKIVFFGLYAALNAEFLLETVADSCLGAEPDDDLLAMASQIARGQTIEGDATLAEGDPAAPRRDGRRRLLPDRHGLPPLDRYVKLVHDGAHHKVGFVTTTRGCKHLCRHCPIPPVYHGRFYALRADAVVADIGRLVEAGARHVTFGDADFLNGPTHALRIARALHEEFPDVTFDFTAKVEHLLRHEALLVTLKTLGCLFVVSAIESLSEQTLSALDKGHSADDVYRLVHLFREVDLTLRPTFVPFTPWDSLDNYIELLELIESRGLIDHVDPVQFGIRLLVPPGSLLLSAVEMQPHLATLDRENLSWRWTHPDPRMDDLQREVAKCTEKAAHTGEDAAVTFARVKQLAYRFQSPGTAVEVTDSLPTAVKDRVKPPRLSEEWFC